MSGKRSFITHSAEETAELGARLGECVQPGDLIVLCGDLGAGKTQLAGGLARALGIREAITSPTYTILKTYEGGRIPLYHFDLYRLDKAEQLRDIDFDEVVRPGFPGVTLVEWGDMFEEVIQEADLMVTLRISNTNERAIELSACTPRGEAFTNLVIPGSNPGSRELESQE